MACFSAEYCGITRLACTHNRRYFVEALNEIFIGFLFFLLMFYDGFFFAFEYHLNECSICSWVAVRFLVVAEADQALT